jgi:hypothetical protein
VKASSEVSVKQAAALLVVALLVVALRVDLLNSKVLVCFVLAMIAVALVFLTQAVDSSESLEAKAIRDYRTIAESCTQRPPQPYKLDLPNQVVWAFCLLSVLSACSNRRTPQFLGCSAFHTPAGPTVIQTACVPTITRY